MARTARLTTSRRRSAGAAPPAKGSRRAPVKRPVPAVAAGTVAATPEFATLQEIVLAARRNLSTGLWDHLSGGSDSETTLIRNRQALDALALRQRVLMDVSAIDTTTTLLGQTLSSPVFLAPVGAFLGLAHPEGAKTVARAAVARGTTAFVSTAAERLRARRRRHPRSVPRSVHVTMKLSARAEATEDSWAGSATTGAYQTPHRKPWARSPGQGPRPSIIRGRK